MAIHPKKKIGHMVYRIADVVTTQLIPARDRLLALKAAFVAQGPDVTGTQLEGRVAQVNAWIADIEAVCNSPIATYCVTNKSNRKGQPSALGKGL